MYRSWLTIPLRYPVSKQGSARYKSSQLIELAYLLSSSTTRSASSRGPKERASADTSLHADQKNKILACLSSLKSENAKRLNYCTLMSFLLGRETYSCVVCLIPWSRKPLYAFLLSQDSAWLKHFWCLDLWLMKGNKPLLQLRDLNTPNNGRIFYLTTDSNSYNSTTVV